MYKVPGAGGAVGAGAGTLAFTGANVTGWIVFGAVLVVAGVVAVLAGRRRRHRLAAFGDDSTAG
ncbi:MAG TPA: peptidase [Pseudonocardiaceae bacterium]|jgi:LPXTG-motif cell wall-anchored protein|nr:peptidase [Pseudonocardiaceae bacterium]